MTTTYGGIHATMCLCVGVSVADGAVPNVQVTRLTLVCDAAPHPLTLDLQGEEGNGRLMTTLNTYFPQLWPAEIIFFFHVSFSKIPKLSFAIFPFCFFFLTGDLEEYKKQSFVLKEGVEYRIKISFKVRYLQRLQVLCHFCLCSEHNESAL